MSYEAYRLKLMMRALERSDAELHGFRHRYLAVAQSLSARLIAGEVR